jgi:hypothetical protein
MSYFLSDLQPNLEFSEQLINENILESNTVLETVSIENPGELSHRSLRLCAQITRLAGVAFESISQQRSYLYIRVPTSTSLLFSPLFSF